VRGLVNHMVSGNLRAAELGSGATIEEAGGRLDGDRPGTDPAGTYAAPGRSPGRSTPVIASSTS
jgi:hypothetical protein